MSSAAHGHLFGSASGSADTPALWRLDSPQLHTPWHTDDDALAGHAFKFRDQARQIASGDRPGGTANKHHKRSILIDGSFPERGVIRTDACRRARSGGRARAAVLARAAARAAGLGELAIREGVLDFRRG